MKTAINRDSRHYAVPPLVRTGADVDESAEFVVVLAETASLLAILEHVGKAIIKVEDTVM